MNYVMSISLYTLLVVTPCQGQTHYEAVRFYPSQPVVSGNFGWSMAVDDGVLIASAPFTNDLTTRSGAVYLNDISTAEQLHRILPPGNFTNGRFGYSVDIRNGLAAVSELSLEIDGVYQGSLVYLYDIKSGELVRQIRPEDYYPGDFFGAKVLLAQLPNGTPVLIASSPGDYSTTVNTGAVHIFNANTGEQLDKFFAPHLLELNWFGGEMAFDDGLLAISATATTIPGVPDSNGNRAGYVYSYELTNEGTATILQDIPPTDPHSDGRFGEIIQVANAQVVVTQSYTTHPLNPIVYFFDPYTGLLENSFTRGELNLNSHFGVSFHVQGNKLYSIDGRFGHPDPNPVHITDIETHTLLGEFIPSNPTDYMYFGHRIVAEGPSVLVSALHDSSQSSGAGAIYLFTTCPADLDENGTLGISDVNIFLNLFAMRSSRADFTHDNTFDFFDVSAFLSQLSTECP